MGQPIEQRAGEALGAEGLGPLVERQVAGDQGAAALVALGGQLEQQLGAGLGEWHEAELVDDQELVAGHLPPRVDNAMVNALARAFRWRKLLDTGVHATIEDLARAKGAAPSYVSRLLRLTLLVDGI